MCCKINNLVFSSFASVCKQISCMMNLVYVFKNTRVNRKMVECWFPADGAAGMVEQAHGGLTVLRGNVNERRPVGLGRGAKGKSPVREEQSFCIFRVGWGEGRGKANRVWGWYEGHGQSTLEFLDWGGWILRKPRLQKFVRPAWLCLEWMEFSHPGLCRLASFARDCEGADARLRFKDHGASCVVCHWAF
jgi:hypothetical protein